MSEAIHDFGDSVPIHKMDGCYSIRKNYDQLFIPIQAIQSDCSVLM